MKKLKYNVGDIVRLEKIIGHYGSGKGCVRKTSITKCVGLMGIVVNTYSGSSKGYAYNVEFNVPYKRPTRQGVKSRKLYFYLMEEELDPLFIA